MNIVPIGAVSIVDIECLMANGAPFITVRSASDYWMYGALFSTTCPVAVVDNRVAGAIVAFRSQDTPADIYVQDVVTHPDFHGRGVVRELLASVERYGAEHGCSRMFLTSEPENVTAHRVWTRFGFTNVPGDYDEVGISVIRDFKGPGKHRAVYEYWIVSGRCT